MSKPDTPVCTQLLGSTLTVRVVSPCAGGFTLLVCAVPVRVCFHVLSSVLLLAR